MVNLEFWIPFLISAIGSVIGAVYIYKQYGLQALIAMYAIAAALALIWFLLEVIKSWLFRKR